MTTSTWTLESKYLNELHLCHPQAVYSWQMTSLLEVLAILQG
jgi:hypothetical protein